MVRILRLWAFRLVVVCGFVHAVSVTPAWAQTNVETNQGIQIDFLNPGARSMALGGAFVGLADDATAALVNPAGLRALTRTEVSVEGRIRNFKTPFVFAGRISGTPSGLGFDTLSTPDVRTADSRESGASFISGVFASAKRPWTVAAFRHETVRFSTGYTTGGPYSTSATEPGSSRFFPFVGNTSIRLVDYGVSGSYRWQRCGTSSGIKTCDDLFAVVAGVYFYQFKIDSLSSRYNFFRTADGRIQNGTGAGQFSGPPRYDLGVFNSQTETGEDTQASVTVGALFIPDRKFQVGVSYRQGTQFAYTAQNFNSNHVGLLQDTSAHFNLPDEYTLGVAVRPGGSTVVLVDYNRVAYSQLTRNLLDLFGGGDTAPANYVAKDSNQIHVGGEHQFVGMTAAPAVRLGFWFDPDHALRNTTGREDFLQGKDVWHYTAGGGIVVDHVEISVGGDFSNRGNIASVSAVVRF